MDSNNNGTPKRRKAGVHFFDVAALRETLRERGISEQEFTKRISLDPKTKQKLFSGLGIRDECVNKVLGVLGIKNRTGLVYSEGEDRESHFNDTLCQSGIQEWHVDTPLTPVVTTTNGLQYRVYRLKHRHQPERTGRGKRYEFWHLAHDAQTSLRELLIRHPKVCDRVGPHPQIPICFGTFPEQDAKAWWVIDNWVEGKSLREILAAEQPLQSDALKKLAKETAAGLLALHKAGIIRRELSPDGIVLSVARGLDAGGQYVLTDFELAKLLDGSPSVSRDWLPNPYRAPEVCEAEINDQADIFSWGRVVIHAALGTLPACGTETEALSKRKLPAAIHTLLTSSVKTRKSMRPASITEVLSIVERWK